MVAYCCVKGCNNNSSNKKKDPNDITSFHAFPTNTECKQKWLRAIGRPDWMPPKYARVCSAHFSYEHVNHEGQRIRIKDDAVPVLELPVNSNFEASQLEVCRFCLAMDLKMYSLQSGVYRLYLESLAGYSENCNIEGLPQFVCYECAALLKKCYNLLGKSMIAQTTLLDIFAHNGQITKNLISNKNRKDLRLSSSLSKQDIQTNFSFHYKDTSEYINNDIILNDKEDIHSILENFNNAAKTEFKDFAIQCEHAKGVKNEDINVDDEGDVKSDEERTFANDEVDDCKESVSSDDEVVAEMIDTVSIEPLPKSPTKRRVRKKIKSTSNAGLTPAEIDMLKYFTIEVLTLEQQLQEWNETIKKNETDNESFKCDICCKWFAREDALRIHKQRHNASRGKIECPVCKAKFKSDAFAQRHVNSNHAKKFHCKMCPKVLNSVGVAKRHHKWHSGYLYRCERCSFTSAHMSALSAHVRSQHAGAHACSRCGHAFVSERGLRQHASLVHQHSEGEEERQKYRCEQCSLSFHSEGARRVHMLTSKQHKKRSSPFTTPLDPGLKKSCNKCGEEFPSLRELVQHGRMVHATRKQKKPSWSLPGDCYPTRCDHCSVLVNSRSEHWSHVKTRHPGARASYRPVITAVCPTCGKGFQNATKLQIHELRHSAPSVRCPQCPRVFYDKYAVARHRATHDSARPHRCPTCPRAFKVKGNLARHARVHSGLAPYECQLCGKHFRHCTSRALHVRTVHHKQPHPPRSRTKKPKC